MSRTVVLAGDGRQRGTLSAARSLGTAGHRVIAASDHRGHTARSRYTDAWHQLPPEGPELVPAVARLVADRGVDAVFACTDEHLLLLSERRDELGAVFPYPEHQVVLRTLDKVRLYETAREVGVTVSAFRTDVPHENDRHRWVAKQRLYAPGAVHACYSAAGLPRDVEGDLVFQEAVEGDLTAVVVFRSKGGALEYVAGQQADRVYPHPYGISVRARQRIVPTHVMAAVSRLLEQLEWWGLAELQFIVPDGGDWHLIDFNGRFFGSLSMTAAGGADLPTALLSTATGEPVSLPPGPRPGIRYQWLEGDLRRSADVAHGRVREIWGTLRFAVGAKHSIWDPRDPGPALVHAGELVVRAARRATGP